MVVLRSDWLPLIVTLVNSLHFRKEDVHTSTITKTTMDSNFVPCVNYGNGESHKSVKKYLFVTFKDNPEFYQLYCNMVQQLQACQSDVRLPPQQ